MNNDIIPRLDELINEIYLKSEIIRVGFVFNPFSESIHGVSK